MARHRPLRNLRLDRFHLIRDTLRRRTPTPNPAPAAAEPDPSSPRRVLQYAAPATSRFNLAIQVVSRAARQFKWFTLHRPLRAIDVAIGGAIFLSAAWVADTLRWPQMAIASLPRWSATLFLAHLWEKLPYAVFLTTFFATIYALLIVIRMRRWRHLALCTAVILPTTLASGVIQIEQCPHATYLQVSGVSIPISGKACNNWRNTTPWWHRR